MRLVGYSDRLSVAPGEEIAFQVSSTHPHYRADIVRLIHGDPNPRGPGFITELIDTEISGEYPGREQAIVTGSYITVPDHPALDTPRGFTIQMWIMPTLPALGRQGLLTKWSTAGPAGFALLIDEGALVLWVVDRSGQTTRVSTEAPLRSGEWYAVAAIYDAVTGDISLAQEPLHRWPFDVTRRAVTVRTEARGLRRSDAPLLIAALAGDSQRHPTAHYNGKIDRPRLYHGPLPAAALDVLAQGTSPFDLGETLVASWDFSQEITSSRIVDRSPHALHGTAVNLPARAMTGVNWTGEESHFAHAPDQYGAIHFHDDDLDDADWETDFTFRVPENLASGLYAARLRAGDDADHLPFVVRPPRGTATASVAFLISTFTYLAYANEHLSIEPLSLFPFATPAAHQEEYQYIAANKLNSLYDTHRDGSGVRYASWKRPMVNLRPDAIFRIYGGPERLGADLYLTHWLEQKGIPYDTIADENLHHEGEDLLAQYPVVVTGNHPEYWTRPMLDALDRYLDQGGRLMYLGGNGFYWVTGVDPERPHVIEIRRWRGTETWETAPGEAFLSTTGEQGGLWRNRNRAPQKRLGVGFTAQGNDWARPYVRLPASYDPRAAFICAGIDGDTIGDFPSLMLRHGAAGYEIDRADPALGTPPHALLLATATGFSDSYQHVVEEILSTDNERGGSMNPLVRADMVYYEGPNSGAVFSVGSIAWSSALSYNDGDNDVSRVTENVLRRFTSDEPLPGGATDG